MMDIERLSQIGSTLDTRLKKKRDDEKERTGKTSKTIFSKILDTSRDSLDSAKSLEGMGPLPDLDGDERIEDLLDDVHGAGEALKRDLVFGPLKEYKRAVGMFIKFVLENGIEQEKTDGIRNPKTLKQNQYVVIRVLDEKLQNLATHVLKGQAEQLDILRRIDEIHGLLVDLKG